MAISSLITEFGMRTHLTNAINPMDPILYKQMTGGCVILVTDAANVYPNYRDVLTTNKSPQTVHVQPGVISDNIVAMSRKLSRHRDVKPALAANNQTKQEMHVT